MRINRRHPRNLRWRMVSIVVPAYRVQIDDGSRISPLAERFMFRRWLQLVEGLSGALTVVVVLAWIVLTMKPANHSLRLPEQGSSYYITDK
jgi:hypothetical protein